MTHFITIKPLTRMKLAILSIRLSGIGLIILGLALAQTLPWPMGCAALAVCVTSVWHLLRLHRIRDTSARFAAMRRPMVRRKLG